MTKTSSGPRVMRLVTMAIKQALGLVTGKPSFEEVALRVCAQGYQPVSVAIHEGTLVASFFHPVLWDKLNAREEESVPSDNGNGNGAEDPEEVVHKDLGPGEVVEG